MPTTQCQIGPRFSAVQPPSELIPCHAIKLPDIPVHHSFSGRTGSRKLQRLLYIHTVYRCYKIPTSHQNIPQYTDTGDETHDNAQRTKLTAYDSTTCSGRANTSRHPGPNQTHTHPTCVIPSKSSHYARQQSPPSSSPTFNHSSPPYPYQSPTISHLL